MSSSGRVDATDLEFESEGATLRGQLYRPPGSEPVPLVVMAHGFSATTRGMVADCYAESFASAGVGAFLYDHRGFGRSDGEPRGEINRWIQGRGYRDALQFVAGHPGVAADRLALWGDSMSGSIAVAVAAVDERVRAIVAQVPACGSRPPPEDPDGVLFAEMRKRLLHGDARAAPEAWEGPMPVVSPDPTSMPCALEPITAFRWFIERGARFDTGWQNRVVRTTPRDAVWHAAIWAAHVTIPTCFIVARDDEMPGAEEPIAKLTFDALAGPKELHEIGGGHFGLLEHPGPVFEQASAIQAQFLVQSIGRPIRSGSSL